MREGLGFAGRFVGGSLFSRIRDGAYSLQGATADERTENHPGERRVGSLIQGYILTPVGRWDDGSQMAASD